jgi:DNA-directed RNA polymerase subunit RPC12/RpoP
MESKKRLLAVGSAVVIVVSLVLLLRRCGGETTVEEPTAHWVCDSCGHESTAELGEGSVDCPECEEGQMVLRVYYRCESCGETFEAYQMNYAPTAERAAAARKEADAQEPLSEGMPPESTELVRKPGGKWAWAATRTGAKTTGEFVCPHCGAKGRGKFKKVFEP